jgi:hypothetical protein
MRVLMMLLGLVAIHTAAYTFVPAYQQALNDAALRCRIRNEAPKVLHQLGLEATRENIDLYMTVQIGGKPPEDGWTSRLKPIPCESIPKIRHKCGFSEHWTYADLLDDELIEVGVFMQRALAWPDLEPLLEAGKQQWREHGIVIHITETEAEFRDALARYDIAMFFGHSNLGQGMDFNQGPLDMGNDTLEIPFQHLSPDHEIIEELSNGLFRVAGGSKDLAGLNIQNKLFAYMGCRSDGYYREVLEAQFPGRDFLLTHYVWSATIHAPQIIRELAHCLEQGQTLEHFTKQINRGHETDVLWGRLKEIHMYKNEGPHSPVLFSL